MRLEQRLALSDKTSVIEIQDSEIERQASQIAKLEEEKQTLARKLMKSKDKQKILWELMGYQKPISQKIYLNQLSKPFCSHLLLKTNYQDDIERCTTTQTRRGSSNQPYPPLQQIFIKKAVEITCIGRNSSSSQMTGSTENRGALSGQQCS
ncbi:hypothetical protein FGO68_gene13409 [Halteria grandinella]|uniref:Uncharacterized protein n=1 Tax=Halteria grandinella TaxID=5974 RepID=A0A8J8NCW7_HALGN|nr:hypothetical protein FGO68_gene13409 [Halteria grandinella]